MGDIARLRWEVMIASSDTGGLDEVDNHTQLHSR